MTPTMFLVEFWRPGNEDHCPVVRIASLMEYDDTAVVCASLKARGYLVEVYELNKVKTPEPRLRRGEMELR